MKFYNPYKPHIAQFKDGKFAVRKLTNSGWGFISHDLRDDYDDYWWCVAENIHKHAKCELSTCRIIITKLNEKTKMLDVSSKWVE